MILSFPPEVVCHIDNYLSKQDYFELALTSRAFYDHFISHVYKDTKLYNKKQYKRLLSKSKYHHLVRDINLFHVRLNHRYLRKLPKQYPSLASLTLNLSNFKHPPSFICPFQNLGSLEISLSRAEISPLVLLSATPYLNSLKIIHMHETNISVTLLDSIHQLCPRLAHLSIQATTTAVPSSEDQVESTQIHSNLETLDLESFEGLGEYHLWLRYIGNRYPHIETLRIKNAGPRNNSSYQQSYEFYDWLWSSCPRLIRFEWLNIVPDDMFLKKLDSRQQQLQWLSLYHESIIQDYLINTTPYRRGYFSNILNLDIFMPSQLSYSVFFQSLGKACPRLQQLNLTQYSVVTIDKLYISTVLDLFPCLTSIDFTGIQVHCKDMILEQQEQDGGNASHPLKTIRFKRCYLNPYLFDCIAPRCRNLKYLTIHSTMQPERNNTIKIHLPYQTLTKIDIQGMYADDNDCLRLVQLFQIERASRSDWYFMDKYKTPVTVRMEEALSYTRLEEVDLDVLNSTISQLYSIWLQPEYHTDSYGDSLPRCIFDGLDLCKIIETGYISLKCQSVKSLLINNKEIK